MHGADLSPGTQTSQSRLFQLPKEGKTEAEYEDACAIREADKAIYVMTDGASDSVFAGLWAQIVADRFAQNDLPNRNDAVSWRAWIDPAQQEWERTVRADPVPWYVEPKIREGAFATCVALVIQPARGGHPTRWGAVALGDSCLFHIPAEGEPSREPSPAATGFPISNPEEFGLNPLALSSNPAANELAWEQVAVTGGIWQPGDRFVLATDALAHWIITQIIPTGDWDRLWSLWHTAGNGAFAELMHSELASGTLRNDDWTLLLVQTSPNG
jgi:hypothetical protein